MKLDELGHCPGSLAAGFATYSPSTLRTLFDKKKVSHILPYLPAQQNEEVAELFINNRKRISISGVQEKLSLLLDGNQLRLTAMGEQGTYILKPIPRDLKKVDQVPANEHLTMQIAKQVYRIRTAENGLIFFQDGTPAYITKRFDVRDDGLKWGKEDFATLAGKTKDNAGPDFKYAYNYEELAALLRQYVPAWRVEIERYFSLVLFNYLFSNGDAHLKNFSLLESVDGDYRLSPAYDLINTRLHVDDSDFALSEGLLVDGFRSGAYRKNGHPSKADFQEFAFRIGVMEKRIPKLIAPFLVKNSKVAELISQSFLSESNKRGYLRSYYTKLNLLNA